MLRMCMRNAHSKTNRMARHGPCGTMSQHHQEHTEIKSSPVSKVQVTGGALPFGECSRSHSLSVKFDAAIIKRMRLMLSSEK